jgi:hypothetical protein
MTPCGGIPTFRGAMLPPSGIGCVITYTDRENEVHLNKILNNVKFNCINERENERKLEKIT